MLEGVNNRYRAAVRPSRGDVDFASSIAALNGGTWSGSLGLCGSARLLLSWKAMELPSSVSLLSALLRRFASRPSLCMTISLVSTATHPTRLWLWRRRMGIDRVSMTTAFRSSAIQTVPCSPLNVAVAELECRRSQHSEATFWTSFCEFCTHPRTEFDA